MIAKSNNDVNVLTHSDFFTKFFDKNHESTEIHKTLESYIDKMGLKSLNWYEISGVHQALLSYFGIYRFLLMRLIYAICKEKLEERKVRLPGKNIDVRTGTKLKKVIRRETKREKEIFMNSLENVISHIEKIAPYLKLMEGNDKNPLGKLRQTELLVRLKERYNAEQEIEILISQDSGRSARYAYDIDNGKYLKVGNSVTNRITTLLLYVSELKKNNRDCKLNEDDYLRLAQLLKFWKFDDEHPTDIINKIKDNLRRYKTKRVAYFQSGWENELIPMIYTF